MDLTEAAARVNLGEIVDRHVACVTPDTSIDTVMRLMTASGHRSLPVVDSSWQLLGMISTSDVLRARSDDDHEESDAVTPDELGSGFHVERHADETVKDVMTPFVYALPEDARITHAISLMAAENVQEVPIVTCDGALVGVVTAVDCMRWIARQMGYAVP
jgi:CBS domain-containing protein